MIKTSRKFKDLEQAARLCRDGFRSDWRAPWPSSPTSRQGPRPRGSGIASRPAARSRRSGSHGAQGVARYSANISPDPDTGIGRWSRADFIARFRAYQGPEAEQLPLGADGFNTQMSWTQFAGMTDDDLGAIYAFLIQSKPISNRITVWELAAAADNAR